MTIPTELIVNLPNVIVPAVSYVYMGMMISPLDLLVNLGMYSVGIAATDVNLAAGKLAASMNIVHTRPDLTNSTLDIVPGVSIHVSVYIISTKDTSSTLDGRDDIVVTFVFIGVGGVCHAAVVAEVAVKTWPTVGGMAADMITAAPVVFNALA
jgi:hypothetical protein